MRSGDIFQNETKISPPFSGYLRENLKAFSPSPDPRYLAKPAVIRLPEAKWDLKGSLWSAIYRRRSQREYSSEPVALGELSQLLTSSQGVTAREGGQLFLAAPSAGALYPLETYLVVHRVKDLLPGLYRYLKETHNLEVLARGDFRREISLAALEQEMAFQAAVVFIWTAVIERAGRRYGQRCYRYIYLEAGHIAQNLSLAAVSLGLGSCMIGALYDDLVNQVIKVDGIKETVVYMAAVGKI